MHRHFACSQSKHKSNAFLFLPFVFVLNFASDSKSYMCFWHPCGGISHYASKLKCISTLLQKNASDDKIYRYCCCCCCLVYLFRFYWLIYTYEHKWKMEQPHAHRCARIGKRKKHFVFVRFWCFLSPTVRQYKINSFFFCIINNASASYILNFRTAHEPIIIKTGDKYTQIHHIYSMLVYEREHKCACSKKNSKSITKTHTHSTKVLRE